MKIYKINKNIFNRINLFKHSYKINSKYLIRDKSFNIDNYINNNNYLEEEKDKYYYNIYFNPIYFI
jgi:hypothetical protein